ncbi:hypothetical protein CK489_36435 [Bradyrhizobium sp. UFLA03-84]|nr:hypothetical protein CK489_36435 [Bradyrhizobium sp. UFLA03-84]
MPSQDPLLQLASAILAQNRQLRAALIDHRWRAAVFESRLQTLSDSVAKETQRAEESITMRQSPPL